MLNSNDIKIVRCNRRSIMIKVTSDAELIVRAPFYVSRSKIDAFLKLLEGYEILELARTGIAGLGRGTDKVIYLDD